MRNIPPAMAVLISSLVAALLCVTFSVGFAVNSITNIQMSPESPALRIPTANINITFDYETDEPEGVRIFFRPMTKGSLSPAWVGHTSPVHPLGVGDGTAWFTTNTAFTTVDQVRVQMWDETQVVLLLEMFVPVTYYFGPTPVKDIVFTPESPASLVFGEQVSITYNYETAEAGGVRILARPFTAGELTGGYSASGSSNHPVGTGAGSGDFTINAPSAAMGESALQPIVVDQIRFQMTDDIHNQSYLIAEFFVPVSFTFDATVGAEETTWGRIKALYSTR